MVTKPDPTGVPARRPLVPPPEGYKVEWQVQLDSPDDVTEAWGVYGPAYQRVIEQLWEVGAAGMDYQPGESQQYHLDFNLLVQTRTSCEPGWGTSRAIRRVFVPDTTSTAAVAGHAALSST